MKALLYPWVPKNFWSREIFPDLSPSELSVVGKSWCWCAVDCCSVLKVSEVLIADCNFSRNLEDKLGTGSYWSLRLSYVNGEADRSVPELLEAYRDFAGDDDVLIVRGLILPDVKSPEEVFASLRPVEAPRESSGTGAWVRRGGRFYEAGCPTLSLDTLRNWFEVNFHLLNEPGINVLPGYSGEKGISIGTNVVIMSAGKIGAPVVLQDNVRLDWGVSIRNGAIVGRNVLVEKNAMIEHSIVLGNTYIGSNMSFVSKIVDGSRVIDPLSGNYVDVEDDSLVRELKSKRLTRRGCTDMLVGLLLAVSQLPLYLLSRPFRRLLAKEPFFQFFFDVYPKYWSAAAGRCQLVRRSRGSKNYVFRYSDLWPLRDAEESKAVDDEFFIHNWSLRLVLAVCFGSLIKRMFVMSEQLERNGAVGAERK